MAGIDVAFGGALGADAVLVHRQHYINISIESNCAGALGRWPDALIPAVDPFDKQTRNAFPAAVAPATNQAFWVDVFVKNGTAPGLRSGTATVLLRTAAERGRAPAPPTRVVLPLSLQVHRFTLPSISRYKTTFNCNPKGVVLGRMAKLPLTRAQRVEAQRQEVDLGLMHRVTFSNFLEADLVALGAPVAPAKPTAVDWAAVEESWGRYLGSEGAGLVDTPYGIGATRPTTIRLPAVHYPGPYVGTPPNRTLVETMWKSTGCTKPAPEWGYAYWSSQADYGARDMLTYCDHCAEGRARPLKPSRRL